MKFKIGFLAAVAGLAFMALGVAGDTPNIVYITFEDICPLFGCHGDDYAQTPHLDRPAADGPRGSLESSLAD